MGKRTYPRISIEDFGHHLLTTKDLDPIYYAVVNMKMDPRQLNRWLLAYWCFYHAGVASYLSEFEGMDYWNKFHIAAINHLQFPAPTGPGAINGGWPRGAERRHFRGGQANKATAELTIKFPDPEAAVCSLVPGVLVWNGDDGVVMRNPDPRPEAFDLVSSRVREWRGFGSWISFKVGDMLDRCGVAEVEFEYDDVMYDTPRQAALMQYKLRRGFPQDSVIDDEPAAIRETVHHLISHFSGHRAPPLDDRPVNLQEIETILCKWKSHIGGSYPLYNDIDEINHGAAPWANHCETGRKFLAACPRRA